MSKMMRVALLAVVADSKRPDARAFVFAESKRPASDRRGLSRAPCDENCKTTERCEVVPGKAIGDQCEQCKDGYQWWPCNEPLCFCPDTAPVATTTPPTAETTRSLPGTTPGPEEICWKENSDRQVLLNWCKTECPGDKNCEVLCERTDCEENHTVVTTRDDVNPVVTTTKTPEPQDGTGNSYLDAFLANARIGSRFNTEFFLSEYTMPDGSIEWKDSVVYRWNDFTTAFENMLVTGIAQFKMYMGNDVSIGEKEKSILALVNVGAFLAQSKHETIKYDACDENNWSLAEHQREPHTGTINYPLDASCGQSGQRYSDYRGDLECDMDMDMEITATTNAYWWGAPPPLFCAKNSTMIQQGWLTEGGKMGSWNEKAEITPGTVDPNTQIWERKDGALYNNQVGGAFVHNSEASAFGGVEGCCWWGRGVIQTTGRGNIGMLNHYVGNTHKEGNKQYPLPDNHKPMFNVNLCKDPQAICGNPEFPDLKWVAGFFFYMQSVQGYNATEGEFTDYDYVTELKKFVQNTEWLHKEYKEDDVTILTKTDDHTFIDQVSGIVNRGCPALVCKSEVLAVDERREFFYDALRTMEIANVKYEYDDGKDEGDDEHNKIAMNLCAPDQDWGFHTRVCKACPSDPTGKDCQECPNASDGECPSGHKCYKC